MTLRMRYLHGYDEVAPPITLIAPIARVGRSTNRSTAKLCPPPVLLLYVTPPGAFGLRPRERIARLRREAGHGLFCCWT